MRRILVLTITGLVLLLSLPASAETTTELQTSPQDWDGKQVVISGELVGDYSVRSNGLWVQLDDGPYVDRPLLSNGELLGTNTSVSVQIPLALFEPETWGPPGEYRIRGPIVMITGVFRYHSEAHQGATFLEATGVEVIEPALAVPDGGAMWPIAAGLGLLGAAAFIRFWVSRRRLPA